MAGTYTTVLGDAWDGIAFKLFGDEKYMKELIEANWRYTDTLVFGSGIVLDVPDIDESEDEDLPFWRENDDSDEDEGDEFYEYETEEDEDSEDNEDLTDAESEEPDSEDEEE